MLRMIVPVWIVVVLLGVTGCGGRNEDSAKAQPVTLETMDAFVAELDAVRDKDGSKTVIRRLKKALDDKRYAAVRSDVAMLLLNEYINDDDLSAAQDLWLKLAISDKSTASRSFSMIASACSSTNSADAVKWCDRILEAPVSDMIKSQTWRMMIGQQGRAGKLDSIIARLPEIMKLGKSDSYNVFLVLTQTALYTENYDILKNLAGFVDSNAAGRDDLKKLILSAKADALVRQKKFNDAWIFIQNNAKALGDADLSKTTVNLVNHCIKQGKDEILSAVADTCFREKQTYPRTCDSVAVIWLSQAVEKHDVKMFMDRLSRCIAVGCSVNRIVPAIRDGFYLVMDKGNEVQRQASVALIERLRNSKGIDEYSSQSLTLMLLDGAFYRNDFKSACKIVENGVPGYDKKWHQGMLDKIGAHLALQEKRYADAIKLFRKHMARIEKWKNPMVNPENGAKMTREAVLAFNEKRIGDIYLKMGGHEKEAKESFDRARNLYNQAISNAVPGSIERKLAQQELSQVP